MKRGWFNYYPEDVRKIVFGKKLIRIYVFASEVLIIPRHCFGFVEEEKQVVEFLKTNYSKRK